jgi:hypothetical protein
MLVFKDQGGIAVPDGVAFLKIHAMGQIEIEGIVAPVIIALFLDSRGAHNAFHLCLGHPQLYFIEVGIGGPHPLVESLVEHMIAASRQ